MNEVYVRVVLLIVLLVPPWAFCAMAIRQNKKWKTLYGLDREVTEQRFVVREPTATVVVWSLMELLEAVSLSVFLLFWEALEQDFSTYMACVICAVSHWILIYVIVRTFLFRILVDGDKMTAFSLGKTPLTFSMADIAYVEVKESDNLRLIIRTTTGEKVAAVDNMLSYDKLWKKVKSKALQKAKRGKKKTPEKSGKQITAREKKKSAKFTIDEIVTLAEKSDSTEIQIAYGSKKIYAGTGWGERETGDDCVCPIYYVGKQELMSREDFAAALYPYSFDGEITVLSIDDLDADEIKLITD